MKIKFNLQCIEVQIAKMTAGILTCKKILKKPNKNLEIEITVTSQ